MTSRSRSVIAGSVVIVTLVAAGIIWFAVIGDKHKRQSELPKTTAELLVGSWKRVENPEDRKPVEPDLFGIVCRFTEDGRYEFRVTDFIRGPWATSGTYQLDGNTIKFFTPTSDNPSPIPDQIWELSSTIESISEEELVIVTVTKKRWAQEMAHNLAVVREVPLEQSLSEVQQDSSRSVYVRIKEQ